VIAARRDAVESPVQEAALRRNLERPAVDMSERTLDEAESA